MQPFESPESVLSDIFSRGKIEVYSRCEVIPTQKHWYQVVSGYVALCESSSKSKNKLIFLFGKNDIFPYPFQLYERDADHTYQYVALDTTQVLALSNNKMAVAIQSDNNVSVAYVRYMANILNMAFERISNLEEVTVMDRLQKRLLCFADRFGVVGENRVVIDIPLTHADIAQSIGTTRETVNRMLNQLVKEKKISIDDRKIIIHQSALRSAQL